MPVGAAPGQPWASSRKTNTVADDGLAPPSCWVLGFGSASRAPGARLWHQLGEESRELADVRLAYYTQRANEDRPRRTGQGEEGGFSDPLPSVFTGAGGSSEFDVTLKFPHRDPKPSARADCPCSLARQTPLAPLRPTCESAVFTQTCGGAISGNGRVGHESRDVDRFPVGSRLSSVVSHCRKGKVTRKTPGPR